MSLLSIDELIQSLTPDQVKATLYTLADSVGLQTTAWQKLSPLRSIFAIISQLFSGYSRGQATINRSGFLDLAVGVWLTLLAYFVYGVTRIPATFAPGTVTIDNGGGGDYTFEAGDLVVLNTTTKKTYVNTAQVHIGPLVTGLVVAIRAVEIGSASTAAPGQIDDFVAASPLLTVTNPAAVVGEDEEADPDLRVRCRDKLGALSPAGPARAYAFIAKTPSLNGGVAVNRVLVRPALGNGTIRVVVAGPDGPISGTTGDPSTDLGKLFLALNLLAVTAGYTLLLSSATPASISLDSTIWITTSSGLAPTDAQAAVALALTDYIAKYPIGGVDVGAGGSVLFRGVEGAIKAANDGILEAKLAVEVDIALAATEVPVLTTPVTTVNQVDA